MHVGQVIGWQPYTTIGNLVHYIIAVDDLVTWHPVEGKSLVMATFSTAALLSKALLADMRNDAKALIAAWLHVDVNSGVVCFEPSFPIKKWEYVVGACQTAITNWAMTEFSIYNISAPAASSRSVDFASQFLAI